MAKKLLLVRHAATEMNSSGRFIGSTDVPISPAGELQAEGLAELVAHFMPERCLCSPLQRAKQTAEVVTGHIKVPGLHIEFDDALREIDFGEWEGLRFDEIVASSPEKVEEWCARSPQFGFPGGEKLSDFVSRITGSAEYLAALPEETVLAVTHGGVVRTMICCLLGLDPSRYLLFDVQPATLAVLDIFEGGGAVLSGLNIRNRKGDL